MGVPMCGPDLSSHSSCTFLLGNIGFFEMALSLPFLDVNGRQSLHWGETIMSCHLWMIGPEVTLWFLWSFISLIFLCVGMKCMQQSHWPSLPQAQENPIFPGSQDIVNLMPCANLMECHALSFSYIKNSGAICITMGSCFFTILHFATKFLLNKQHHEDQEAHQTGQL